MLSDIVRLRSAVGIPATVTDTTLDQKLAMCLVAADTAVKNKCHRTFETSSYILEFPFKGNTPDLPLLQRPVRPVLATATLTNGSTALTNIAVSAPYTAAQILDGMPVCVTGAASATLRTAIPPFTTISAGTPAGNPTSATLSQAPTASGTLVPVCFGLDVYIDFGGNYGFGANAFKNGPGNSSRLYIGLDYAPMVDQPDGSSKSGLVTLLGQSNYGGSMWALAPLGMGWGGLGGYGPYGGPLTQAMPPVWPTYPGAVCVTYAAGVGAGGAAAPSATNPIGGVLSDTTSIPADLTAAVTSLAAWLWNAIDAGAIQTNSESFQGYSRSLADAAGKGLNSAPALGSTRDILSRYMEVVW